MKKVLFLASCCFIGLLFLPTWVNADPYYNEPDSAYLVAYATEKNRGHNGLHFAWSLKGEEWKGIGPEHSYLKCDYGTWGNQKRMLSPYVFQGNDGWWHCIWSVNESDGVIAHAKSEDLIFWYRQSYPIVLEEGNVEVPVISTENDENAFTVTWKSTQSDESRIYRAKTQDFKAYGEITGSADQNHLDQRQTVEVNGVEVQGTVLKVSWETIDGLIKAQQLEAYQNQQHGEKTAEDPVRFKGLEDLNATLTINASDGKEISDMLMGIFFEDINYAADGGLYAELVQNRGFEYSTSDKKGRDKSWNAYKAWSFDGLPQGEGFVMDTLAPLHPNNPHYAILDFSSTDQALTNEGFGGMVVKKGEKYDFSTFTRLLKGEKEQLTVRLMAENGEVLAESTTKAVGQGWKQLETTLAPKETDENARLAISYQGKGLLALDMISLFPQNTFKSRKNGLRADLAQAIADMQPRFIRFPGGCVAHGDGLANMYRWKNTIGPLEARKPQRNIWNYHQTAGLGYFEYFQFCEDVGAEPVPVVAAGVPCQNSATGGAGQQCGIPMSEMDEYVQEVLDLIEWANGDKNTAWGQKRAAAGHPEPFDLKYVGIGNEDLITDVFEERFTMIYEVVKEKYPEITVIGTVGPFYKGTDYVEGWDIATKLGVPMVDEHYYQPPGWFIHNQDYYDRYDRSRSKVYLGEYASHLPGRPTNLETALSEALYLTSLERNGDIVSMASYAPLLAKEGYTQWNPDLIYFNNTEVKPTVGYYVQQLYGQNAGEEYLSHKLQLSEDRDDIRKRVAISTVREASSGDIIVKLVNMLPVAVKTDVELENAGTFNAEAMRSLLTGDPDDRDLVPQVSFLSVGDNFEVELPAYSFSVIRILKE